MMDKHLPNVNEDYRQFLIEAANPMSDRHTQFRIILGAITEYAVIILGVLKALQLLDKLVAWCVEGMSQTMVALGIVGIILLILIAILYDHANAADVREGDDTSADNTTD